MSNDDAIVGCLHCKEDHLVTTVRYLRLLSNLNLTLLQLMLNFSGTPNCYLPPSPPPIKQLEVPIHASKLSELSIQFVSIVSVCDARNY